jgi:hypothetical protein
MQKVIRNGQVAVLYSPGFGAGWYSWNDYRSSPECMFHPVLVDMVEQGRASEITEELVCKLLGIEEFYDGGAYKLKIEGLPVGTLFRIKEYDGSETVETFNIDNYIPA